LRASWLAIVALVLERRQPGDRVFVLGAKRAATTVHVSVARISRAPCGAT
jgi:hypothetical protein